MARGDISSDLLRCLSAGLRTVGRDYWRGESLRWPVAFGYGNLDEVV